MPAVLLATDADWLYDEVDAALGSNDITVYRVRNGVDVLPALLEVDAELAILDLQIGNMGGMATCMAIRHEEGMGRIPITGVLMLLDRAMDTFLSHRSDADGWLIKPLDAFRLRKATQALLDGGTWFEEIDQPETVAELPGAAGITDPVDDDVEGAAAVEPEAEPADA